jgi:hypothetical protein
MAQHSTREADMKSTLRLAPNPTKTKPRTFAEALKVRASLIQAQNRDPQYQALRLRGLAGLIRATEDGSLQEITNLQEVAFFIATTIDDVAEALSPDVER